MRRNRRRKRKIAKNPSVATYAAGALALVWLGGAVVRYMRNPDSSVLGLDWPIRGLGSTYHQHTLAGMGSSGDGLSGMLAAL